MAVVCMSVNAQTSGSCGTNATWEYDSGTLTISGTGAMEDYSDASINTPWKDYTASITSVIIEDGITHVGNFAFNLCTGLTNVTIGNDVMTIGNGAFDNCTNNGLTSLYIPDNVESIGIFAFSNNHLKYVCLGSGLTSIGNYAFYDCQDLEYIGCYASAPPTVGSGAFSGVTPTAIYVPTDYIGDYQTADGWSTFTAVIGYPHGNCGDSEGDATDAVTWSFDMGTYQLTLAGTGAIKTFGTSPEAYPWNNQDGPAATFNPVVNYANTGIQTLVVGEGITNIPDYAFHMQANLMSVSLPSTLKSIGNSAMGETAIWSIYLPEGLETIGHYAFLMSIFESISIPSTVTSIGEAAFAYGALTSIGCYASTPPTLGNNAFGDDVSGITSVYVPSAKVQNYKDADGWSVFGDKIKSPTGDCGTNATWSYEMATRTLTIEGTGTIDNYSGWGSAGMYGQGGGFNPDNFNGYPCGIENVVIGEGIEEILVEAFYMEVGLKKVTLPSTLTFIKMDAFGECSNIETINSLCTTPPTLEPNYEDNVIYGSFDPYTYDPIAITTLTKIYVPHAAVGAYTSAAGWSTYSTKIEAIPGLTYDSGTTTYTFSRTGMTAGANSTICLPFDYEKPAGCTFYEFTNVAKNGSGEWEATFTELAGNPSANTPYIFTNTGTSVNITKNTGAPVNYPEGNAKTTVGDWTFQATYSPITWTNIPKGYYGYAGQATATATAGQFVHLVNGASAAPFRAYLKCNNTSHELYRARTRGGNGDAQPQTIIVRLISASGEATNIGTIDTRTGEMNLDGEAWYSLDGRKLTAKPSKKGVYINNGKSVLVK